jgi:diguanylate cyclase (GGDEF)-like protein/PAS domain S-box-containing protein
MVEERLAAARVAALFGVAKTAYATSLAAGLLLCAILWDSFAAPALLGWLAVLVALVLARIVLHRSYLRDPGRHAPRAWEARFGAGAIAAGIVWSLPAALFFPAGDPLLQMAVIFVVGGSVIGAAGVYAASPLAFFGFCVPPILAAAVQLSLQAGRTYPLLAMLALVFGVAMVRVFKDIHGHIVGTLRERTENELLLARVAQSEAQLRDAIESFPEGIAVFDREDRLVVCNESYARDYGGGKRARELAGTPYAVIAQNAMATEVMPPEYAGRRAQWLQERLERRQGTAGAVRLLQTVDGRWLHGRWVHSRDGGIVSMFADVTELRRAQDAYGQVVAEEKLVLDTLPVGVAFMVERMIVRCNRRLEQMLGYGPGELNGKSTRVLYPSDEVWRSAGEGYGLLRGGAVHEGEMKLQRKDGTVLYTQVVARATEPDAPQASLIITFSDISERHAAELALRKSEAMFRNLVETSNDLVWSLDAAGRWTYLSPDAARRIYGCEPGELLGRELRGMCVPEVAERDAAVFGRILAGEAMFDYETRHLRRDGSHVDLSFNAIPLRDATGAVLGATGTARDVSLEKAAAAELHESVERLRLAVDTADLQYWEWDRETDSMRFGRGPQAGAHDARRMRFGEYLVQVHEEDRERLRDASLATQHSGEPYELEFRIIGRSGRVRWMHARGKAIPDRRGEISRVIGVSQDITERKRQEEEARFLAYHDTLTGLPNRRLLDDRLRQAVFLAQRRDARVAVMVVDLDRFKQVNDALGHRAGDSVLREAAHRIAGCVRKADTLARHGGDEFVVVIPDLHQDGDCQVVAEKILRSLEPPFVVDGREFTIGASIGVSLYPADAGDGEGVLRNADAAMYRAKQLGRNNYRFYGR